MLFNNVNTNSAQSFKIIFCAGLCPQYFLVLTEEMLVLCK